MTGHRSPESAYVDIFTLSSKEFTSCFVKSLLIVYILCTSDILIFLLHTSADCTTMDRNSGTRLRPRIDDRMENFLQSFRVTTEKFLADLGSLLSETVLALKDSCEAVHTTLTDSMEKIAVTLTQMNDQFKESSMDRNDAEAKERAKIIRDKIQFC